MQLQITNIHSVRIKFLYLNSTNILMKQSKERNGDLKAELWEVTERTMMSPTIFRSNLLLLWFYSYFIFYSVFSQQSGHDFAIHAIYGCSEMCVSSNFDRLQIRYSKKSNNFKFTNNTKIFFINLFFKIRVWPIILVRQWVTHLCLVLQRRDMYK